MLNLVGTDETTGQQINARKVYEIDAVVPNMRFADVLKVSENHRQIDYTRFHDVVPLNE